MAAMTRLATVDQPVRKAPAVLDASGTPDVFNLGGVSWIKSLSVSVSNGLRSILKFEGAVFSASLPAALNLGVCLAICDFMDSLTQPWHAFKTLGGLLHRTAVAFPFGICKLLNGCDRSGPRWRRLLWQARRA